MSKKWGMLPIGYIPHFLWKLQMQAPPTRWNYLTVMVSINFCFCSPDLNTIETYMHVYGELFCSPDLNTVETYMHVYACVWQVVLFTRLKYY